MAPLLKCTAIVDEQIVLCPAEMGNTRDEGIAWLLPSRRGQEAAPFHESLDKQENLQKKKKKNQKEAEQLNVEAGLKILFYSATLCL